jgi:hypothetical protein
MYRFACLYTGICTPSMMAALSVFNKLSLTVGSAELAPLGSSPVRGDQCQMHSFLTIKVHQPVHQ